MAQIRVSPLGLAIRTKRESRGLTRQQLADLLNQQSGWDTCTPHTVYRWETGYLTW